MSPRRAAIILVAAVLIAASARADEVWHWSLPPVVPEPVVPADNPMSAAKVELGRRLFYDTRLSGNGTLACAICHLQKLAFTDGRPVSVGSTGHLTDRNAPPLANVAWFSTYTWANPALVSLERQMEVPLFFENTVEMGINDANRAAVLARFASDADLAPRFAEAFPGEAHPVSFATIIKAIATFERSILSFDSRYDRYRLGRARLTKAERRGMTLFFGAKAGCSTCHSGFNFTDQTYARGDVTAPLPFHDIGMRAPEDYAYPNRGVFELSGEAADRGRFRTPSLRNVALSAPYLHDGSAATLDQAIAAHRHIALSASERRDLIAFLATLSDPTLIRAPELAP